MNQLDNIILDYEKDIYMEDGEISRLTRGNLYSYAVSYMYHEVNPGYNHVYIIGFDGRNVRMAVLKSYGRLEWLQCVINRVNELKFVKFNGTVSDAGMFLNNHVENPEYGNVFETQVSAVSFFDRDGYDAVASMMRYMPG